MSGTKPAISSLAKPVYLKEQALQAVKEAIITHQLKPNELYNESSLFAIAGMRDLVEWMRFEPIRQKPDLQNKYSDEHRELIAALEQGDHGLAGSVMSRHIDRGRVSVIKALNVTGARQEKSKGA